MSARAPLGRPSRNTGKVDADWTSATQIGVLVSVVIVQAAATSVIHMQRLAVSQVLQSRRKTGTLSGSSAVTERSDARRRERIGVVVSGGVDDMGRVQGSGDAKRGSGAHATHKAPRVRQRTAHGVQSVQPKPAFRFRLGRSMEMALAVIWAADFSVGPAFLRAVGAFHARLIVKCATATRRGHSGPAAQYSVA